MSAVDIASWVFLITGSLACVIGAIGLLRLPDFYARTHAASINDTLGAGLILAGLMLQAGATLVAVKLLMVFVFLLLTGPTSAHALAKAAARSGVKFEQPGSDEANS